MVHLKADAHLFCIFPEYPLVGHNQEAGGILPAVVDSLFQYLQAPLLPGQDACNSRLGFISFLCYLLGSHRRVLEANLLPVPVFVQVFRTLHQSLGMGIHGTDLRYFCIRCSQQGMPDG